MTKTIIMFRSSLLFLAIVSSSLGQVANWAQIQPFHQLPQFFDDYPLLRVVKNAYQPNLQIDEQEGELITELNAFPHQVALILNRTDGTGFCGGSLISNQWILTSAHCLSKIENAFVILGGNNLRNANETGQSRINVSVSDFIVHPGWNGLRLSDDVGLVKLPNPIVFNNFTRAVRLPNRRQVSASFEHQRGYLSGWGRALYLLGLNSTVGLSFFRIEGNADCRLSYPAIIESAQMCGRVFYRPDCIAESGGPLTVIEADGIHTQIGIVSFLSSSGCVPAVNRPSVFNRVTFYLDWIAAHTNVEIADDFVF